MPREVAVAYHRCTQGTRCQADTQHEQHPGCWCLRSTILCQNRWPKQGIGIGLRSATPLIPHSSKTETTGRCRKTATTRIKPSFAVGHCIEFQIRPHTYALQLMLLRYIPDPRSSPARKWMRRDPLEKTPIKWLINTTNSIIYSKQDFLHFRDLF